MYALVDCNSFFCSVEISFRPWLRGKPVCVLSNNDGCIVALTKEAKAVGLHRGDPVHQVRGIIERNDVTLFSGNMMLYSAMSKRVMSILARAATRIDVYSIDEAFLDLSDSGRYRDIAADMRALAAQVLQWTGIPVSIGVAPTRTLAKMGSRFAKEYPGYHSVCMIDSESRRLKALELFDLADVWGIGRRTVPKLAALGVKTPLDLARKPEEWVKRHFNVNMYRTWLELNGHSAIDTMEKAEKQTITTSRSFSHLTDNLEVIETGTANFAASCANKLRAQNSLAGRIGVCIMTSTFREDLPQHIEMLDMPLCIPTADTTELVHAALQLVRRLYRPGYKYKKTCVMLSDIIPAAGFQQDLFDPVSNRPERAALMHVLDDVNTRYGLHSLQFAVQTGHEAEWRSKHLHNSPDYLTNINEIPVANAR